ncbi:hypothetical protein [Terrabacter terrigena]|uniref:ESAT-6 protein secretion system EspG family protein n=1 Tax=Terrabacter terrigena TaxID=574718 RepID=A0ABW3N0S8_9MICO
MSIEFDPAEGTLRLDAEAFITLAELSSYAVDSCDATLGRLTDAGAVLDGVAHPLLRTALASVAGSVTSLQVLVAGPEDVRLHHGWVSDGAALLTDLGDGTYDFAPVGAEFVPESVARLTRVGPRPRLGAGSVVVDESVLDDVAASSSAARVSGVEALAGLLTPWPAAAASVRAGGWHLALVDVTFVDDDRTVARRLAWLDTDAGMLRVEVDDHGPVLVPVSTTDLWRAVVAVLPDDLDPGYVARSA